MKIIMNIICVLSAFVFGTGIIYIMLDGTIGKIKHIHSKFEWNGLQIKDFIFLLLSAVIILTCFDLVSPY